MMKSLLCLFVVGFAVSHQTCVDLINSRTGTSDCPARRNLCNDPTYYNTMTVQCPLTCGRCTGTCVDKINPSTGRSDCPQTAHLCNDFTYYSFMTEQCPRTCNRCPPGK